jgi:hypothetical protein
VPLVEQELLIIPGLLRSTPVFSRICVVFCTSLFLLLFFFLGPTQYFKLIVTICPIKRGNIVNRKTISIVSRKNACKKRRVSRYQRGDESP